MKPNDLKDWLIPVSTFVTLISMSTGIWISLEEYRLKTQAEIRLTESARAEMDIRLLTIFTDILQIATGRKGDSATFSKEMLEKLFEKNAITDEDFKDLNLLKAKITNAVFLEPPVGASSVTAAFASIATLAKRHDVLKQPAIQALESFKGWAPDTLVEKYLREVRERDETER